jgi:hypothetical protein
MLWLVRQVGGLTQGYQEFFCEEEQAPIHSIDLSKLCAHPQFCLFGEFGRANFATFAAHSPHAESAAVERDGDFFATDGGNLAGCCAVPAVL